MKIRAMRRQMRRRMKLHLIPKPAADTIVILELDKRTFNHPKQWQQLGKLFKEVWGDLSICFIMPAEPGTKPMVRIEVKHESS